MKSMTGMGRAQGIVQGAQIRIEIRSINHRFCEVSVRLPSRYLPLEILIQQSVKKNLARGKIDIFVSEEKTPSVSPAEVEAYKACHQYYAQIQKQLGLNQEITLQDLMAGVGHWMQRDLDAERVWTDFQPLLGKAVTDLVLMRTKEGANLKAEMLALFGNIQKICEQISKLKDSVRTDVTERLKERIASHGQDLGTLDPLRLEMEIIFYLDRIEITEELQRLKSHLNQVATFFKDDAPSGRKIDFLLQEFNREFNTIASKSQSGPVAHLVVEAKAELEKIREQVQNIE